MVVMNDGKIIADGTPKEVFSQVELLRDVGLTVPETTDLLYELNGRGCEPAPGCPERGGMCPRHLSGSGKRLNSILFTIIDAQQGCAGDLTRYQPEDY